MVQTFWPLTTHSSPSCTARVGRPATSEPCARLGEQLAPDVLAGEDPAQVLLLQLLGAVGEHGRGAHADADRVDAQVLVGDPVGPQDVVDDRPAGRGCRRGRRSPRGSAPWPGRRRTGRRGSGTGRRGSRGSPRRAPRSSWRCPGRCTRRRVLPLVGPTARSGACILTDRSLVVPVGCPRRDQAALGSVPSDCSVVIYRCSIMTPRSVTAVTIVSRPDGPDRSGGPIPMRTTHRGLIVVLTAFALFAAACGGGRSDSSDGGGGSTDTTTAASGSDGFGDLASPCGPAEGTNRRPPANRASPPTASPSATATTPATRRPPASTRRCPRPSRR